MRFFKKTGLSLLLTFFFLFSIFSLPQESSADPERSADQFTLDSTTYFLASSEDGWVLTLFANYVRSLALDPTDPQVIYAGTGSGIFKSTDGGASWSQLNQLDVRCLAIDPTNTQVIYAGAGGIFKSTDGGASWSQIGLVGCNGVYSLAIDPTNTKVIYAGTRDFGIFKSTDGGASWSQIGLMYDSVFSLALDPMNPQVIYAGTAGCCIFKSTDGGASWSLGIPMSGSVISLAIDPTNTQVIYAGRYGGIKKSTDGGASWSDINNGLASHDVYCLAIDPSNTQVIYAGTYYGGGSYYGGGVFKSTDGGASWSQMGLGVFPIYSLAVDPTNPQVIFAGAERGIWKWEGSSPKLIVISPNGGEDWPVGTSQNITWTSTGVSGNVKIELKRDDLSLSWETLFASTENDGSQSWIVTGPESVHGRIRISSINDPTVYDVSNRDFTISFVPVISLSPTTFSFTCTEGNNPPSQFLQIRNAGGATLNWMVWDSAPWLNLSPTSGSSTGEWDQVALFVNSTGLSAGTYSATITVFASGASNSPQYVPVTLQVSSPNPTLYISPTSLDFGTSQTSLSLTIQNTGVGTLSWSASESLNWLSLSKSSGSLGTGQQETISVSVSRSGLTPGTYSGTISFTSNGGNQNVSVSMTVSTLSTISLTPNSFSFTCTQGTNPPSQTLQVRNSGGGTLNWTVSDNADWLSLSPTSGSSTGEWDDVTVSVNTSGLSAGTYSATITVSASGASNSPQYVPVTLRVNPNTVSISFSLTKGWNMISLGLQNNQTAAQIFGSGLLYAYQWDPPSGTYLSVKNQPLFPGKGYWLRMSLETNITAQGIPVSSPQVIPLYRGWIQIGNPYEVNLPVSKVSIVKDGQIKSLQEARTSGWISYSYSWNGTSYDSLDFVSGTFYAGKGYWLRVLVEGCSIKFER